MSTVTLTQADNGKTVEVRQGDTIAVQLAENPTTGFRWAIDKLDQKIAKPQNDSYSPASGGGVGGGGMRTFTLLAAATGTTPLELKLWREWEGNASITQRFAVNLHIT